MAYALADLESLLRDRKLGHTLPSSFPEWEPHTLAPTGIAEVDQLLGGGFPRGQISEIVGAPSSGRTSLFHAAMARATGEGEVVALIDALDRFDPASAARIYFPRLLWIRGPSLSPASVVPGALNKQATANLLHRAVDRALKATNLVLQARGFGLVVLDLADVPRSTLRRIPFTTWLRLQRVLEASDTACAIVARESGARSPAGVSLQLQLADRHWSGTENGCLFRGVTVEVRVIRAQHPNAESRIQNSEFRMGIQEG